MVARHVLILAAFAVLAPTATSRSQDRPLTAAGPVSALAGRYSAAIITLHNDWHGIGGFSRNHWITSRQKMLSPFGSGQGPFGDNALRLYDPVTRTIEQVWPAGHGNGGVQKRDNHGSLYVPALDEFWVWGGSYLETYVTRTGRQAYRGGRFSFRTSTWVAVSESDHGAFAGLVKDGPVGFSNGPACAWSAELDMGVCFGGSIEGNASNRMAIIERNPGGPERYRWVWFDGPRPPARSGAHNLLAAAGRHFYLFAGQYQDPDGRWRSTTDFWRFDGERRLWERLADPPFSRGYSMVTYDSDLALVVVWAGPKLLAYEIATGRWHDVTPADLPCAVNMMAVYAPTAKLHIYQGGVNCTDGAPVGPKLRAIRIQPVAAPAPPSSPPPTHAAGSPPASSPAPTPAPGDRIALPLKQWVAVPLGPPGATFHTAPYGSKHVRPAFNSRDGRIYFWAGDYARPEYPGNVYAYSIRDNRWEKIYQHCTGEIEPFVPDQNSWCYDSKRNLFHWNGGFTWGASNNSAPPCPTTVRRGPSLSFDPVERRWLDLGISGQPTGGSHQSGQFSVYDPVSDNVIILALWQGNAGVIRLDLATRTWTGQTHARTEDGFYINDGNWSEDNQPAIDVQGRAVYIVDRGPGHQKPRLLRYNIDRRTVSYLGPTPVTSGLDIPLLAFDPINRVLYWLTARESLHSRVWAYHVGTARWEELPILTADGVQARGNVLVFDPSQNALMLIGGVNWHGEPAPSFLKYLFLYRHGTGAR